MVVATADCQNWTFDHGLLPETRRESTVKNAEQSHPTLTEGLTFSVGICHWSRCEENCRSDFSHAFPDFSLLMLRNHTTHSGHVFTRSIQNFLRSFRPIGKLPAVLINPNVSKSNYHFSTFSGKQINIRVKFSPHHQNLFFRSQMLQRLRSSRQRRNPSRNWSALWSWFLEIDPGPHEERRRRRRVRLLPSTSKKAKGGWVSHARHTHPNLSSFVACFGSSVSRTPNRIAARKEEAKQRRRKTSYVYLSGKVHRCRRPRRRKGKIAITKRTCHASSGRMWGYAQMRQLSNIFRKTGCVELACSTYGGVSCPLFV